MRRLLPAIVAVALLLGSASSAFALGTAAGRVPAGVKRVTVAVTFPAQLSGSHKPVRRTFTGAVAVREAVNGADALQLAVIRGACPMFIRVGPELTVIFRGGRAGSNAPLAEAQVEVVLGTHGSSASSACFPIHFTSRRNDQALVGNGFVRLMGRLLGTAIS